MFININKSIHLSFCLFVDITVQVLDVTKSDAVKDFAEKIDKIDVLFNCAGLVLKKMLLMLVSYITEENDRK